MALENAGVATDDIDLIVLATATPDNTFRNRDRVQSNPYSARCGI